VLVEKARNFAITYHEGQKYKGLPYIEHLRQVATFLILELDIPDVDAVAAAYLHDILEDTQCTAELLDREFNQCINTIVKGVTRDPHYETNEHYIGKIRHAGRYAMAVKTADRVCNLKNLILDAEQGKLKPKLIERYEHELELIQKYFPAEFVSYIKRAHGHLRSVL
jgi:(p)ppGpp synthase/HD superfamily hydrolase